MENYNFVNDRTDLALEKVVVKDKAEDIKGITVDEYKTENFTVTDIVIKTESAAKRAGKPIGRYTTIEIPALDECDNTDEIVMCIAAEIKKLMGEMPKSVLVAGLGNRQIPPDALGSRCIDRVIATRVISDNAGLESEVDVSAIAPGVLGVTGIETAEILSGICDKIKPQLVIVIDSLCARDIHRIGNTIQMTNTGIAPGAGLGNNRNVINSEALGCDVIAIGVPMVVYARTICHNVLEQLARKQGFEEENAVESVMADIDDEFINELVVTPKDVDNVVDTVAQIIAMAINRTFGTEALVKEQKIGVFAE